MPPVHIPRYMCEFHRFHHFEYVPDARAYRLDLSQPRSDHGGLPTYRLATSAILLLFDLLHLTLSVCTQIAYAKKNV